MNSYAIVGCWGGNERADEHGIHTFRWNSECANFTYISSTLLNVRAGGMCWHPEKNILYIPNESAAAGMSSREGSACIYAVSVNEESGEISEFCHVPAFGSNPAYVALDKSGRYLLSANHGSPQGVVKTCRGEDGSVQLQTIADESNVALFSVKEDGSLEGPLDIMVFEPKPGRRTSTHCAMLTPFGNHIAICDIEDGCLYLMGIDEAKGQLFVAGKYDGEEVNSARYCVFHPREKYIFINNEHDKVVTALAYDEEGNLSLADSIEILPETHKGPVQQSGVRITPNGKYLYTLIRAINSVAAVKIKDGGKLEQIQLMAMDCVSPKDCAVTPDGKYLWVAGKVSGEMLLYGINEDGTLNPEAKKTPLTNPANIAFVIDGKPAR